MSYSLQMEVGQKGPGEFPVEVIQWICGREAGRLEERNMSPNWEAAEKISILMKVSIVKRITGNREER